MHQTLYGEDQALKAGLKGGNFTVLSEVQLDRIYKASISLLADPGIQTESTLFMNIFEKNGARNEVEHRLEVTE
jgi:trimethylamine:corrinoid methyltransferase-like protein